MAYDGRQNITGVPGLGSYGYNGANELTSATVNGTTTGLSYDPAGRLYQSGPTRFLYDGVQAIGEYDTAGNLQKRYVPGLGLDEVVTAYEGSGYDRRWLLADERGSVISITDGAAGALTTNTYDEYGVPGAGNSGRFQYTGQMWLPQAQLYHYRARAYAPQLGRFMQTDPIGYAAGANVYGYVGADPMNWVDPFGLKQEPPPTDIGDVVVTAPRLCGSGEVEVGKARDGSRICEPLDNYLPGPVTDLGEIVVVGSPGGAAAADEQQQACTAEAFSGYIGNPAFERQAREAMRRAQSTPNRGLAGEVPANGTEHGFFAGYYLWGLALGPIFTSHRELRLTPEFVLKPPFSARPVLYHTHQSPSPDATGTLSKPDIRWSNATGIPIIADNEDGARYCHVPR